MKTSSRLFTVSPDPPPSPRRPGRSSAAAAGILALGLAALTAGCGFVPGWSRASLLFFDTMCEIRIYGTASQQKAAEAATREIFEEIERLFSPGTAVLDEPRVLALFKKARPVHRASGGSFDLTIAPLSRLWGFRDGKTGVPAAEDVKNRLLLVGMDKISIEGGRLLLPEGMELDWGGIAKGYGIDLTVRVLIDMGIRRGFVNAGGDLYCWGRNPDARPWRIGVQHPRSAGFLGIIEIENEGAATTGDYQRYFFESGVRWHHVFDPRTGYPARGKQSVTVVGPETAVCDALSTALFVSEKPEDILKSFPDYGAVLVDENGDLSFIGKSIRFR